jgi:hypothetical protein
MTANRLALIDDNSQPLPEYWLFVVGQMTEDDVIQIADGDVGNDFHGHLSGIRTLMESTHTSGFTMTWCPEEALSLYRWHDMSHVPHPMLEDEQRRCIFCVAALLIAATIPGNSGRFHSTNENLAILLSHHAAMGWSDDLLDSFLAWLERELLPELSNDLRFICLARGIVATWKEQPRADDAACFFHRSFAAAWQQRQAFPWRFSWNALPWSWVLNITAFEQCAQMWCAFLDQALTVSATNGWNPCVAELTKLKVAQECP